MKKYFYILSAIIALQFGGVLAPSTAHADCIPGTTGCDITVEQYCLAQFPDKSSNAYVNCIIQANEEAQQYNNPKGNPSDQSGASLDPAAAKQETNTLPSVKSPDLNAGVSGIMAWIASLFAWLLGVAVIALNYSVYYTVATMGTYVNKLTAVGTSWLILRDIGNIALIFGFLAIGISTILDTDRFGWKTKMLPMLLIGAIFLNFSLFFTEAVIDTGNLFATQFFKQINGGNMPTPADLSTEGISGKIMANLGLTTIYDDIRKDPSAAVQRYKDNSLTVAFLSIILFLIASFVMFALALVLIARFVILLVIIIVAPIGFAGLAIPQLSGLAKQWWSTLLEQTITAPVLLLLLYIALRVITGEGFLGFGPGDWSGTFATSTGYNIAGFASILLSFLVAMGLLLAVLIASKKMSAFGAGWATGIAGKATFGLTAAGLRTTVGWGSQRASERFRKSRWSRAPIIGRTFAGVLDAGAKGSFDARASKLGGTLSKDLHINTGEAQKGGYRGWEKEKVKARETYAKDLEMSKEEKAIKEAAEKRKGELEKDLKKTQEQHKGSENVLREQQKVGLASIDAEILKAQRAEADLLERKKNNDPTVRTGELIKAKEAIKEAEARKLAKIAENQKEVDALKENNAKQVEVFEKAMQQQQEAIWKIAPQEQYAKGITWGPGQFFKRNVKAAENIRKELKKGKSEREFDGLKKLIEDGAKKGEGGGGKTPSDDHH